MKNKKILILLIVLIIGVIITLFLSKKYNKETVTGAFNNMIFKIDNYTINLNSLVSGHSDSNADFTTYYTSDLYKRENYEFQYDIQIYLKFIKGLADNDFSSYSTMENINLFNRNFKYQKISDTEILLIYKYDNDFYITINLNDHSKCYGVDGNYIYDESGKELMLEKYDFAEFVRNNNEFKNSINIQVNKN